MGAVWVMSIFKRLGEGWAEKRLHARGRSWAEKGRWAEAVRAFQRAATLRPSATSWRFDLIEAENVKQGMLQEKAGQAEAAKHSYANALNCGNNGFWAYDGPRKLKFAARSKAAAEYEGVGEQRPLRCQKVLTKERMANESPIERIRELNQAGRILEALDVLRSTRASAQGLWQECLLDQLEAALVANKEWLDKHYPDFTPVQQQDVPLAGNCKLIARYTKSKERTDVRLRARAHGVSTLFLFVNDRIIKAVNPKAEDEAGAKFIFDFKPSLLQSLPPQARLALGSARGILRTRHGAREMWLHTEGGQGDVFDLLSRGYLIDKKGAFHEPITQREEWQRGVLDAYTQLRAYFKKKFDRDLFVVFGALLGYVRENNFIASDDDLDVAFFCSGTTAEQVKEETISICRQLAADGWEVRGGNWHKRRLGHVLVNGFDLDFFPAWEEDGKIWLQNISCHERGKEKLFPLQARIFKGVEILIPHQSEQMLEDEYGPGWRVPDPGYQTPDRSEIREHLRKMLLTPEEYSQLVAEGVLKT
jgi:hypothetical protein